MRCIIFTNQFLIIGMPTCVCVCVHFLPQWEANEANEIRSPRSTNGSLGTPKSSGGAFALPAPPVDSVFALLADRLFLFYTCGCFQQ